MANPDPEDGPMTSTFEVTHDHLPHYTMPCHNGPLDSSAPVKYTVFAIGGHVVWHKFTHVLKEHKDKVHPITGHKGPEGE
jgi:hypothetical protein